FFTKAEAKGKTIVLTVEAGVNSGKYSITLPKGFVKDNAINENESAAVSKVVDFGKPAEGSTTFDIEKNAVQRTGKNIFTVTYPDKVAGGAFDGSATNPDRYTLNGKALPTGTKITLNSEQKVATITLPEDS